jgi:ribosomal protein S18 acetylase RimI-like enzyme
MYDVWLEKCAENDRNLFAVAVWNTKPVGFITVENGDKPKIGLIGTYEPGIGIGRLLLEHASAWALRYAQTISVTTQARNVVALRFYGRTGFEVTSVRYVYHLWFPRSEPAS